MALPSPLKELVCGICLADLLSEAGGAELGELDSCAHRFCYPCISKWAEIENSCPFCKQRFGQLRRKRLPPARALVGVDASGELPGTYVDSTAVEERNQRVVFEDPNFQQWIDDLACLVCGAGDNDEQLMLCEECDRACHSYCLGLPEVPTEAWFCPDCTRRRQRRSRQQQQRPAQRRQPAAAAGGRARAAAGTAAGRGLRRRRDEEADVVDLAALSSSENESELEASDDSPEQRPARRRRAAAAAGAGARRPASGGAVAAGGRRGRQESLDDFIVSDEEEEDWSLDEEEAERPARRRGGAAAAPQRRGAGRQAARRRRQASSDSEASTRDRFNDSGEEEEADFTDSGSEGEEAEELEEEEQPLLARLQRRGAAGTARTAGASRAAGGSRPTAARSGSRGGGRSTAQQGRRGGSSRAAAGSSRQRLTAAAVDRDAPTEAHRQVNALAANWEDLRQGNTSFAAIRRAASGGPPAAAAAAAAAAATAGQPQRRRLVRAGALGGSSGSIGGAAGGGRSPGDVVDLLDDSPLPGRRLSGPAAAGATAEEQRSWDALEAAVGGRPAGRRRSGASRPAEEDDSDLDLPLTVRIRRQLQEARRTGAQLLPRQPSGAGTPGAPPSTGRRTARDMRLLAAAARGGGSTPGGAVQPFRIPRQAGRTDAQAAAGGSGGSGASPAQRAQQAQQGGLERNPFTRYQLNGPAPARTSSGSAIARANSGAGGSRGAPPKEPALVTSPRGRGSGGSSPIAQHQPQRQHQQQQRQQERWSGERRSGSMHLNPDGGSPRRLRPEQPPAAAAVPWVPPPAPPLQWQQQQQYQQPQRQQSQVLPQPQQQQQQQQAPSPGISPLPPWQQAQWPTPAGATPQATPGAAGGSWATDGRASSIADFSFHTVRESLPPRSGSQPGEAGAGSQAAAQGSDRWAAASLPSPPPSAQQAQQQVQQQARQTLQQQQLGAPASQRQQHAQQQAQHAPREWPRARPPQSKHEIVERLKPLLKRRLADGLLNRETYKLANKAAVGAVFDSQMAQQRVCGDAEVESAVASAVQRVLNGELQ